MIRGVTLDQADTRLQRVRKGPYKQVGDGTVLRVQPTASQPMAVGGYQRNRWRLAVTNGPHIFPQCRLDRIIWRQTVEMAADERRSNGAG